MLLYLYLFNTLYFFKIFICESV